MTERHDHDNWDKDPIRSNKWGTKSSLRYKFNDFNIYIYIFICIIRIIIIIEFYFFIRIAPTDSGSWIRN